MIIVDDELWLCDECVAHSEIGSPLEGEADQRVAEIEAGLAALGNIAAHEDGEWLEYSRWTCDCCGTSLAGPRTRYVQLAES